MDISERKLMDCKNYMDKLENEALESKISNIKYAEQIKLMELEIERLKAKIDKLTNKNDAANSNYKSFTKDLKIKEGKLSEILKRIQELVINSNSYKKSRSIL